MNKLPTISVTAHRPAAKFVRMVEFDRGAPISCGRATSFQLLVEDEENLAIFAIGVPGRDGFGMFVDHTREELIALRRALDGAIAMLGGGA